MFSHWVYSLSYQHITSTSWFSQNNMRGFDHVTTFRCFWECILHSIFRNQRQLIFHLSSYPLCYSVALGYLSASDAGYSVTWKCLEANVVESQRGKPKQNFASNSCLWSLLMIRLHGFVKIKVSSIQICKNLSRKANAWSKVNKKRTGIEVIIISRTFPYHFMHSSSFLNLCILLWTVKMSQEFIACSSACKKQEKPKHYTNITCKRSR